MGNRIKIPISLKLVFVTIAMILAAAVPIAFRSSQLFEDSLGKGQQRANAELANLKSSDIDDLMLGYIEKIRMVTNLILIDFADDEQRRRALDQTFGRDLDIVNVDIFHLENGKPKLFKRQTNEGYFKQFGLNSSYLDRVRKEKEKSVSVSAIFTSKTNIHIRNTTLAKGAPLFSIGVPFPDKSGVVRHIAIGDFRLNRLQKSFNLPGFRTLFLVDDEGVVLAHKNDEFTVESRKLDDSPIVQSALMRAAGASKGEKTHFYDAELGQWMVGAYSKNAFGLTVIAEAPEQIILEPARRVKYEAFEVAGYAISAALFFVIIFSFTLTSPIERLNEVAEIVGNGNFNAVAYVDTSDEVGDLARTFNKMVIGLKERDKVKNILTKFHGSSIAEDLLKKDLNLGGTRKNVTVFFSDIRSFTKYSENHTPEEVVDMLNEYFQVMVSIITKNQGVVDKFVGDAIMAIWGAPNATGDESFMAVRAALEMRVALNDLNKKRLTEGKEEIRVGMGLHAGTAISGTIGSTERMEYTVIGDTVNMASRIEASTKAFGADLLISETVAQSIEKRFVLELAGSAEVKGKSDPIKMFKVRGVVENGAVKLVTTPYSDYQAEHADKVKVA